MPNLKLNEKNADEGDGGVWSKIIPSEREREHSMLEEKHEDRDAIEVI